MPTARPKVLVTGGAGFIGSHSVEALLERGWDVVAFDDLSTGRLSNLPAGVEVVEGSILDLEALTSAMAGCRAVLHLAAVVSVPLSIDDPINAHEVNVSGTLNVLEVARRAGTRRVVIASSAAVYGDGVPPLEEDAPTKPLSPYALHKLTCEHYGKLYASLHRLEVVALRYFNVFGPRQDPSSPYSGVLSRFADAARTGKPATILGDGEQTRDFVFVTDVAQANAQAVAGAAELSGRVFNIASGTPRSIKQALAEIQKATGWTAPPEFAAARPGDIRHSSASTAAAATVLGWGPVVDFRVGIRLTCQALGLSLSRETKDVASAVRRIPGPSSKPETATQAT